MNHKIKVKEIYSLLFERYHLCRVFRDIQKGKYRLCYVFSAYPYCDKCKARKYKERRL